MPPPSSSQRTSLFFQSAMRAMASSGPRCDMVLPLLRWSPKTLANTHTPSRVSASRKAAGDGRPRDRGGSSHPGPSGGHHPRLSYWPTRERVCAVSYTHLRAHETDSYLVCRLLLEKK